MNITDVKKVHMVGIKGVGMTALAELLAGKGVSVSGSDVSERFFTDEVLEKAGISVGEFLPDAITSDLDAVIYSTAYNTTHIQLARAVELGIPLISYPEALAQLFNAGWGIAVAGSHGKTTTSALLGFIMRELELDPTVIVGSKVIDFGGNAIAGKGKYFVIEADEYQNKLEHYHPRLALITSVDYDHPDFFPDRASYAKAFSEFSSRTIHEGGKVVVCIDDEGVKGMIHDMPTDGIITYGWSEEAQYRVRDFSIDNGITHFTVTHNGKVWGPFANTLVGRHNVSNACGVIALLDQIGVDDWGRVATIMGRFSGTARRFERKGMYEGITLIDDYAHHPTEVKATLGAARELFGDRRIWCVFAAHTFSRTEALLQEFGTSFTSVNRVLLLDIYASAREQEGTVRAQDLAVLIAESGVECEYVGSLEHAADYVRDHSGELDILITMGAGDAWRVGDMLLGKE